MCFSSNWQDIIHESLQKIIEECHVVTWAVLVSHKADLHVIKQLFQAKKHSPLLVDPHFLSGFLNFKVHSSVLYQGQPLLCHHFSFLLGQHYQEPIVKKLQYLQTKQSSRVGERFGEMPSTGYINVHAEHNADKDSFLLISQRTATN